MEVERVVQEILGSWKIRRQKMAKRPKKRARLTAREDRAWVIALCYYVDEGYSDLKADKLTWRDMCEEFPRLKQYDGCLP